MLTRLFAMPENRLDPENGPEKRSTSRRALAAGAGAVAVCAAVSLLRTSGTGPFQSVFEEDARDVLTDALDTSTAKALIEPIAGYYVLAPRLLGEFATLFPVSWMAAVLSVSSAVICGLLAVLVYVASGAHLPHRSARLLVSAPMLLAPVAENHAAELYNRPVCLHFFALYALFWVLVWPAATRPSRAAALVTAGLTAASTILAVGLVPLALLRLAVRRDRHSLAMAALLTAGAAVQVTSALTADSRGRPGEARVDPLWALSRFVGWAVPESILGFRGTSGLYVPDAQFASALSRNALAVAAAWAVVLLVIAVAALGARRGLLRPRWVLAGALAAHSAGLLMLEIMANGWVSQRYLLAPSLLLFAALVVLLLPEPGTANRGLIPLGGLALLLLVTGAANFRQTDTHRHDAPRWTEQVREAAVRCGQDRGLAAVAVRGGPSRYPSWVIVPCHELVGGAVRCAEPTCVRLPSGTRSEKARSEKAPDGGLPPTGMRGNHDPSAPVSVPNGERRGGRLSGEGPGHERAVPRVAGSG